MPNSRHARPRRYVRALVAIGAIIALLGMGQLAIPGNASPASAAVYDASAQPLKFRSSSMVPISPSGATGKNANDVVRFNSVTTIDGMVIDAVVRTVAVQQATIGKFDDGSAVKTAPPGSTQTVDDLLLTDIANTTGATEPMVTLEFSFYEGGTFTGIGTGVPVTLANVAVNAYDIDSASSKKQFNDFRGFQAYKTYSDPGDATKGLEVLDKGNGLVRFLSKTSTIDATATTGSYSWSRVQVNYDTISTLTVRLGVEGAAGGYYALDFSAGGIWTTDGTTQVTPVTKNNPFNTPPTTANIAPFYAAQTTGYVFRAADFPYADVDNNAFAAVRIVSLPGVGAGILEYFNGSAWIPVTAGQLITTNDLDLGALRLVPTSAGGSFAFQVNDGLAFSSTATLTFTPSPNAQTIDFPTPATLTGGTAQSFASTATATSGLTPTLTSLTPGVCTVSGLNITALAIPSGITTATCVIVATQDGDPSYGRAEAVTRQFSVTKLLGQTITFVSPGDRSFDATPIPSGANSSSGLPVTLTSLTPAVCTVTGTTIQPVTPGSCSLRATQAGDATRVAAAPVTRSFALTKVPQAITFAAPPTAGFNGGPVTFSPTTDAAGLTVTLTSSTPLVCTVSGFTTTFVAPGVCTVTATQAGDGTRTAATAVTRSFRIIEITTASFKPARAGAQFSQQLSIAGAVGGGVWTATGLPAGLALHRTTGVLSGVPSASFNGTVTISYTEGGATQLVTLALDVDAPASSRPAALVVTGAESFMVVGIGGLLLFAGAVLALVSLSSRRRRGRHAA